MRIVIATKRFMLMGLVWLALTGAESGALAVGIVAAACGAWLSLRLLPPAHRGVSLPAVARMFPRFLWHSILGGVDVAWRALHPRMPLRTGWVVVPTMLPEGGGRVALGGEFSLLPGTLVAGTRNDCLLIHQLDMDREIAGAIEREEKAIAASKGLRLKSDEETP